VAITYLGMVPDERLHPKAAYSRCRPMGACDGFPAGRPVDLGN